MTEIHWPVEHAVAGADIHVVNRAVSTASPEQVWACIVRPDRWSEIYPAPTASVTSPGHGRR